MGAGFLVGAAAAVTLAAGAVAYGGFLVVGQMVETPPYTSIKIDGDIELRDYPALRVAEVKTRGGRQEAVRSGFGPLAGYIFARERPGEKISMTAPVTQQRHSGSSADNADQTANGTWRVRFIMPSEYTLADLPEPASGSITIHETDPQQMAAIRFSGVANDTVIRQKETELKAWIAQQGLSQLELPVYAYYNDPFTPGPLRRNEVLIAVE